MALALQRAGGHAVFRATAGFRRAQLVASMHCDDAPRPATWPAASLCSSTPAPLPSMRADFGRRAVTRHASCASAMSYSQVCHTTDARRSSHSATSARRPTGICMAWFRFGDTLRMFRPAPPIPSVSSLPSARPTLQGAVSDLDIPRKVQATHPELTNRPRRPG